MMLLWVLGLETGSFKMMLPSRMTFYFTHIQLLLRPLIPARIIPPQSATIHSCFKNQRNTSLALLFKVDIRKNEKCPLREIPCKMCRESFMIVYCGVPLRAQVGHIRPFINHSLLDILPTCGPTAPFRRWAFVMQAAQ